MGESVRRDAHEIRVYFLWCSTILSLLATQYFGVQNKYAKGVPFFKLYVSGWLDHPPGILGSKNIFGCAPRYCYACFSSHFQQLLGERLIITLFGGKRMGVSKNLKLSESVQTTNNHILCKPIKSYEDEYPRRQIL